MRCFSLRSQSSVLSTSLHFYDLYTCRECRECRECRDAYRSIYISLQPSTCRKCRECRDAYTQIDILDHYNKTCQNSYLSGTQLNPARGKITAIRHIFLIGLPGSGKSTIGRLLAQRLGKPLLDID